MIDRDSWLNYFHNADPAVQNYLLSNTATAQEVAAQQKLGYDTDAWDRVMDVVWQLLFEKINRLEWQNKIKQVAIDRDPVEVERAMLLNVVLPLSDLVPWDVEGRLQEIGVKLNEMQSVPRVNMRPLSYGAAVRRIAGMAKLSILSEDLIVRMREVLVSFLKGTRTSEQMLEVLQRKQAEEGIGLSRDQADAFMKSMYELLNTTQFMSEKEYADWFSNYQREVEQQRIDREQEAKRLILSKEEAELSHANVPNTVVNHPKTIEEGIRIAKERIGDIGLDEYFTRRLENIISTRLRDIRNSLQVKQLLMRDEKVGGLNKSEVDADKIAGIIEGVWNELREQIEGEERQRIDTITQEQKKKIEERKKRESEEHAKWFQEKVKSVRQEDALREQYQAAQAKTYTVVSTSTPSASTQTNKPSLDGVVAPRRMMGVEDELGTMTWASFRLLSREPEKAAEKILQKIDTLKQESFDRWTAGIEAWKSSPMSQEYLRIVAESFAAGKPVAQLVEEKRQKDPQTPTPEEIGAIVKLNSQLQW